MVLVFLSYRRSTAREATLRIHGELTKRYGDEAIFLDEKSIPRGEDFRDFIRDSLSRCEIFLPIMGPECLEKIISIRSNSGDWENPRDWVALELKEALSLGDNRVIPLLIDIDFEKRVKPRIELFPQDLKNLFYRNAFVFSSEDFAEGIRHLFRTLDRKIGGSEIPIQKEIRGNNWHDKNLRTIQFENEAQYCIESKIVRSDFTSEIYLTHLRQYLGFNHEYARKIWGSRNSAYHGYKEAARKMIDSTSRSQHIPLPDSFRMLLDSKSQSYLRRLHQNMGLSKNAVRVIESQLFEEWRDKETVKDRGQTTYLRWQILIFYYKYLISLSDNYSNEIEQLKRNPEKHCHEFYLQLNQKVIVQVRCRIIIWHYEYLVKIACQYPNEIKWLMHHPEEYVRRFYLPIIYQYFSA
ncbi:toll/interleukin-1 receptor domain-containing protein [Nodosilinea nodulosa]|uniref:toll/interleukin-1 receptor domain-containing protein n=1 Tax=Nodosilinea nodulosa TaxID=416001 RepID=UPI000311C264|nr:toll/interleukin-1 receptor domain-containing protein [Nodosilinea nodulosa]